MVSGESQTWKRQQLKDDVTTPLGETQASPGGDNEQTYMIDLRCLIPHYFILSVSKLFHIPQIYREAISELREGFSSLPRLHCAFTSKKPTEDRQTEDVEWRNWGSRHATTEFEPWKEFASSNYRIWGTIKTSFSQDFLMQLLHA